VLLHLARAVNERAEDDAAVGNRDAASVSWCAAACRGGVAAADVTWVDQTWAGIRPLSTSGSYVSSQSRAHAAARLRETYRSNFERLVAAKTRCDPSNLFRVNRNIVPRSPPPSPKFRQGSFGLASAKAAGARQSNDHQRNSA